MIEIALCAVAAILFMELSVASVAKARTIAKVQAPRRISGPGVLMVGDVVTRSRTAFSACKIIALENGPTPSRRISPKPSTLIRRKIVPVGIVVPMLLAAVDMTKLILACFGAGTLAAVGLIEHLFRADLTVKFYRTTILIVGASTTKGIAQFSPFGRRFIPALGPCRAYAFSQMRRSEPGNASGFHPVAHGLAVHVIHFRDIFRRNALREIKAFKFLFGWSFHGKSHSSEPAYVR